MKDTIKRLQKLDAQKGITPDEHIEANNLIGDLFSYFGQKDIVEPEVDTKIEEEASSPYAKFYGLTPKQIAKHHNEDELVEVAHAMGYKKVSKGDKELDTAKLIFNHLKK